MHYRLILDTIIGHERVEMMETLELNAYTEESEDKLIDMELTLFNNFASWGITKRAMHVEVESPAESNEGISTVKIGIIFNSYATRLNDEAKKEIQRCNEVHKSRHTDLVKGLVKLMKTDEGTRLI